MSPPTIPQLVNSAFVALKKGAEYLVVLGTLASALWVAFGGKVDAYVDGRVDAKLFEDKQAVYLSVEEANRRGLARTAQIDANSKAIGELQAVTKDTNKTVDDIKSQIIRLDTKQNAANMQLDGVDRKLDELKNILIRQ